MEASSKEHLQAGLLHQELEPAPRLEKLGFEAAIKPCEVDDIIGAIQRAAGGAFPLNVDLPIN